MGNNYNILVINPGSTSTKVGLYRDVEPIAEITVRHSREELAPYETIFDQYDFRLRVILDELGKQGIELNNLNAVIGRGGLLKPLQSGVYEVTEAIIHDLKNPTMHHASNLGGLLALGIAQKYGIKAFIADPCVTDELQPVARITGLPMVERRSIWHALNQKAVARGYAAKIGKKYEEMNLVVAHLGGGISVGAHRLGRAVDVNNALMGEGPIAPERSGTLPADGWKEVVESGEYSSKELDKLLAGKGGMMAHLGTASILEVLDLIKNGDEHAKLILDAMCYTVGKQIGAMATVLEGKAEVIILTGGIAYSDYVCNYITKMCSFIAPVVIEAGENELGALAYNAVAALDGEIVPMKYE
ncbi:MAG: butyrate kinase [Rikenellaceae bacterium]|nr:butyrate kinase [Rikenellaceae bacterium]